MQEPGHIYVLINPSMEGWVKVGKTTRDPEDRAAELSQATGVATPFYVAFSIAVADCHSAEDYVHTLLEHNGFKRAPNREFFEMPLRAAIEILLTAEKHLREEASANQSEFTAEADDDDDAGEEHPGRPIFERAVRLYYGLDDEIKDESEALHLLRQAKELNFPAAYVSIASHYISMMQTCGRQDMGGALNFYQKAYAVLKEGSQRGHGRCFAKMAEMHGDIMWTLAGERETDNETKCWRKYFRSQTFIKNDDRRWACSYGVDDLSPEGQDRLDYITTYLHLVVKRPILFDPEIRQILLPLKEEIVESISQFINRLEAKQDSDSTSNNQLIETYRRMLALVKTSF